MIVLCSADEKVRQRWRDALQDQDNADELSACTAIEELSALVRAQPDAIVLLHLNAPGSDPEAIITSLCQAHPAARLIACVDLPNDEQGLALLKAGVYGYCNTWIAAAQLQMAIEQVRVGEAWIGRSLILHLIRGLVPASPPQVAASEPAWLSELTERECEVTKYIAEGYSNKRIASALDITERTVKAHLSAIFRKTGCKDRVQLALLITAI